MLEKENEAHKNIQLFITAHLNSTRLRRETDALHCKIKYSRHVKLGWYSDLQIQVI